MFGQGLAEERSGERSTEDDRKRDRGYGDCTQWFLRSELAGLTRRSRIIRAQIVRAIAIEQVLPEDTKRTDVWWQHPSCSLCRFSFGRRVLREAGGREEHNREDCQDLHEFHGPPVSWAHGQRGL